MMGQGFRGNCDSQGKLGMCPSLAEPVPSGFSKSHVSHETIRNPLQLFPRNSCKITAYCFRETRRSCSPHLEKLSLFSPPAPCAKSMAQGFRCLRAAIRATRPEPRQHFWKIAGAKNFLFACGSFFSPFSQKYHPISQKFHKKVWQSKKNML